MQQNQCKLKTQYQQYDSLQEIGVGGLQSGIPAIRDGFSPAQIDLGRYLFFDPLLSGDKSFSCATCHDPQQGLADGKGRSMGIDGKLLSRSAPTLWNVGFLQKLFWDGRASSLEEQMLGPLYDAHEMANTPVQLLNDLQANALYRQLFSQAFPNAQPALSLDNIYTAIAAFESSLVSLNSRYDMYAHGMHDALSDLEIEGMNVFRSFVARCAECHTPPLFTNQQIAVIGTPEVAGLPFDIGAEKATGDPSQRGGFKVPTLRNIARTAPYMHSGTFATLEEAAQFYTGGRGHAVPVGLELNLHWHIWEPNLAEHEIKSIAAFLGALTDEGFRPATPLYVPSGLPVVQSTKSVNRVSQQSTSP